MGKRKKILIVDDEKEVRLLLKNFLEGEGFDVKLAGDGERAVEMLEKERFDLMIIDMLLPGEHGIDVVKNINNKFLNPVIVMSGIYEKNDILSSLKDYNIKQFFKKPFDLGEILESVRSAFNEESI